MQAVGVVFNAKPVMPKRSEDFNNNNIFISQVPALNHSVSVGITNSQNSAFTASTELSPGERREIHD